MPDNHDSHGNDPKTGTNYLNFWIILKALEGWDLSNWVIPAFIMDNLHRKKGLPTIITPVTLNMNDTRAKIR